MIDCRTCGFSNRVKAGFCASCGGRLGSAEQPAVSEKKDKPRRIVSAKSLVWALVPLLGLAGGFVLSQPSSTPEPSSPVVTQSPSATEQPGIQFNSLGVPTSCSHPYLMQLAESLLIEQMGASGEITVSSFGYLESFVDLRNTEAEPTETKDPSLFAHIECNYDAVFDDQGFSSFAVYLVFDSASIPRDWMGSSDEQEITLDAGEKLAVFYPSGGGYEYGGGSTWRIWAKDGYFSIDTWSANGPLNEFLPINTVKKIVQSMAGN